MDPVPSAKVEVEPPRGVFTARVDDRGRLKLPSAFQQYLTDLGEKKVFITSLDTSTTRIYPISVWKENEKLFDGASEDPDAVDDVNLLSNHLGADSDVDSQGRVLLPQELRRKLNLENQPVFLEHRKGRINVYGEKIYEARLERAMENAADKLRRLEKLGFK